jgi:hypothetical protein
MDVGDLAVDLFKEQGVGLSASSIWAASRFSDFLTVFPVGSVMCMRCDHAAANLQ